MELAIDVFALIDIFLNRAVCTVQVAGVLDQAGIGQLAVFIIVQLTVLP